jgi:hypothetical protein
LRELGAHMASLPKVEALAMQGGGAWPSALARARLGERVAAPELIPLLAAARAQVRAAAARALGELEAQAAAGALSALRARDADPFVRAEAAVAMLRLGASEARDQVVALLAQRDLEPAPRALDLQRRASLALASHGDRAGQEVLVAAALDARLDEPQRVAALRALLRVGDAQAGRALLPLLDDVRLRSHVADVLAGIAGSQAIAPLSEALARERYPQARHAEARALLALGARTTAIAAIRRFLGTESSMPNGVLLLLTAGDLARPSGAGADLRSAPRLLEGAWQCAAQGCRPAGRGALRLPAANAPRGPARVVVRAHAATAARRLTLAGTTHTLAAGEHEIATTLERVAGSRLEVEADEGVFLTAWAAVPRLEDIAPPAPEPW